MRASGPALREHVKYCRDGRECRFPAPLAGISPSLRVIWGSRQEPANSQTRKIAWPDEMPSDQRDEVSRSPPAELLSSEYSSRSGGTRCCEQPGPDFAKVPQPAQCIGGQQMVGQHSVEGAQAARAHAQELAGGQRPSRARRAKAQGSRGQPFRQTGQHSTVGSAVQPEMDLSTCQAISTIADQANASSDRFARVLGFQGKLNSIGAWHKGVLRDQPADVTQ